MCPDYSQLPKGYLQRALEGMKRDKGPVTLHVVITSWGSMAPILFFFCGESRLKTVQLTIQADLLAQREALRAAGHQLVMHAMQNYTNPPSLTHKSSVSWVRGTNVEGREQKKRS